MALIDVQQLSGQALNWALAACELQRLEAAGVPVKAWVIGHHEAGDTCCYDAEDWSQIGPIMAREGICPRKLLAPESPYNGHWLAAYEDETYGDTKDRRPKLFRHEVAQVAIARCYIARRLGIRIEIPDALALPDAA
ncbi:hypothetical protein BJI67_16385 (plasmid) [Acidihalobacter aeolianus]|uniref:DUF2591 domain-containing protein n=1 Tax=Acidihalobacter aeolianus TaxID=2792603 RepID=A0A1D8KCX4_9GAMM|nr:phage protein NinX family protein [Acidihalobacter aeolianus]AOV18816.1 hypothetical protein BJI67_16385 [Acidihalobacter aeolianus]